MKRNYNSNVTSNNNSTTALNFMPNNNTLKEYKVKYT